MGHICDQIYAELIAAGYFFQTLSLDLQRFLQPPLSLFRNFFDLLLQIQLLLFMEKVQFFFPEPDEQCIQKHKLDEHRKDHHVSCRVIILPAPAGPQAAGQKVPHIPQRTQKRRRAGLQEPLPDPGRSFTPRCVRIRLRHPQPSEPAVQQGTEQKRQPRPSGEISQ